MSAPVDPSNTERFRNRVVLEGTTMTADISGRITAASTHRPYDQATSLEITLWDDDMLLLTSGLLTRTGKARKRDFDTAAWARFGAMRLTLDGIAYRLAGTNGTYDATGGRLTLTFEDEVAALLRRRTRVLVLNRADRTRGVFIARLVRSLQEIGSSVFGPRYFIPESLVAQHVKGSSPTAREKARSKGFAKHKKLEIDAREATDQQKRELETALTVADEQHAGERATLAMLVAGMGESQFRAVPNAGGSNYWGVFQGSKDTFKINDTAGMAKSFLLGGKGFQAGGAKKAAAENPDWSAGTIAYKVEGDRSNFNSDAAAEGFYQQYFVEAQAILEAWGGAGETKVVERAYRFRTKKHENYLAAAFRIGLEVKGWRLYIDNNELVYASDEWLFKRQPTILIRPGDGAVRSIAFTADVGVKIGELTAIAGSAPWVGPPASVIEFEGMGPLNGRWLLALHERDELLEESTLTLRRPAPKGPEPAPTREKVTQTESVPETGSTRALILRAAEKAYKNRGDYVYVQTRPMPSSLFGKPKPKRIDCSSFATLVYKAAGAPDPNGRNYDGYGYTGSLWANGTKTNDPQPGDLCFFGDPASVNSHVNVYAGDGKAYNMGPSAGLSFGDKDVRSDFHGYRTYDLGG